MIYQVAAALAPAFGAGAGGAAPAGRAALAVQHKRMSIGMTIKKYNSPEGAAGRALDEEAAPGATGPAGAGGAERLDATAIHHDQY